MNRPIRHVAVVAAIMFFALLANVTYIGLVRSPALLNDPQNRRVRDAQFTQSRGDILVGNTAIVTSKAVGTGTSKYQRVFTDGPLWAPVTGYYSYEFGRSGLEQSYNAELTGNADSQFLSRVSSTLSGKQQQGSSVVTTLNAAAQQAAWNALGDQSGAVVAINYKTGAILAMVSKPGYDPNTLASSNLASAQASWKSLNADKSQPMANRATREIYPPGSTFKLVTASAALESGMKSTSQVDSPSRLLLPDATTYLTNEDSCGGTRITLDHALQVSCNTAFANVGLKLGADKLREQAEKYGFNDPFTGDVSSVASQFPRSLNRPQTALSAIGQFDVAATPLQMAVVAGAIANGGQVMQPYLVQEVRSQSLQVQESTKPKVLRQAVSSTTADQLQSMMVNVVKQGTGTPAQVQGVRIGGKTGTAQTSKERAPYAWFVGFADDPDVAIAVFIENANVDRTDIAGGRLAGPIFADVVKALR